MTSILPSFRVWSRLSLPIIGSMSFTLALPAHAADGGTDVGSFVMMPILALVTIAIALLVLFQARQVRSQSAKASNDLDSVSSRLLRLESKISDFDRQAGTGLRSTVAEVTAEIGLLGGLVKDLALAVAIHDKDMMVLKQKQEEPPASSPGPSPDVRPLPSSLVQSAPVQAASAEVLPLQILPMPAPSLPVPPALELVPEAAPPRRAALTLASETAEPDLLFADRSPAVPDATDLRIQAIKDALKADRIELHLQPIVSLPQRKVRFYEALARLQLEDGTLLQPADFVPVLERRGLAADLDRKVIAKVATIARRLSSRGSEAAISCNLSPASLHDLNFLRSLVRVLETFPDIEGRLILEISQRSWRNLSAEAGSALSQLRRAGAVFALDRATDLRIDALALADRGVSYVKLPATLMLDANQSSSDLEPADLAAILARAGIKLIAERVETESQVPDLIELNAPMAQGFVFAPPRPVRAELFFAPPATEPIAAPEVRALEQAPAEPAAERLPLRAFLRRAV